MRKGVATSREISLTTSRLATHRRLKKRPHADKRLGIGLMRDRLDAPRELLAKAPLAPDVSRGRPDRRHRSKTVVHFLKAQRIGNLATHTVTAGGLTLSALTLGGPG